MSSLPLPRINTCHTITIFSLSHHLGSTRAGVAPPTPFHSITHCVAVPSLALVLFELNRHIYPHMHVVVIYYHIFFSGIFTPMCFRKTVFSCFGCVISQCGARNSETVLGTRREGSLTGLYFFRAVCVECPSEAGESSLSSVSGKLLGLFFVPSGFDLWAVFTAMVLLLRTPTAHPRALWDAVPK